MKLMIINRPELTAALVTALLMGFALSSSKKIPHHKPVAFHHPHLFGAI